MPLGWAQKPAFEQALPLLLMLPQFKYCCPSLRCGTAMASLCGLVTKVQWVEGVLRPELAGKGLGLPGCLAQSHPWKRQLLGPDCDEGLSVEACGGG